MSRNHFAVLAVFIATVLAPAAAANERWRYAAIQARFPDAAVDQKRLNNARMQGECLVGLKTLNFRGNQTEFDPVAEWSNYRTVSLLEQYSPCEVLVMLEVAHARLKSGAPKSESAAGGP